VDAGLRVDCGLTGIGGFLLRHARPPGFSMEFPRVALKAIGAIPNTACFDAAILDRMPRFLHILLKI